MRPIERCKYLRSRSRREASLTFSNNVGSVGDNRPEHIPGEVGGFHHEFVGKASMTSSRSSDLCSANTQDDARKQKASIGLLQNRGVMDIANVQLETMKS